MVEAPIEARRASLFATTVVPPRSSDNDDYELGVRLTFGQAGHISAVRYCKTPGESGVRTGRVWSSSGTLLASATFTNETTSGWQQANLATPVAVAAGQTFVISVNSPADGGYAYLNRGFSSALTSGPISAAAEAGVFSDTPGNFPTRTYQFSNYYRDVVFDVPGVPARTPLQSWQTTWSAVQATSSIAPGADPDDDGHPNLLEYALGLDPLTPDTSPPLTLQVSGLSPQPSALSLTFLRARADLIYTVEASATLAPHSWQVIATDPGTVGSEVTVTDTPPPDSPCRFLRLRVTPR
jgi:hypothetical protein